MRANTGVELTKKGWQTVYSGYCRGIITEIERENGTVWVITDNDGLRITAKESNIQIKERVDGGFDIDPGWRPKTVEYTGYQNGTPIPTDFANHLS